MAHYNLKIDITLAGNRIQPFAGVVTNSVSPLLGTALDVILEKQHIYTNIYVMHIHIYIYINMYMYPYIAYIYIVCDISC